MVVFILLFFFCEVKVQKNTVLSVLFVLLWQILALYMDQLSILTTPIARELEDFRRVFDDSLSNENLLLSAAIAHIRKQSGKMMRPILVLLAAKSQGAITPATLHAAASLELLHTASLVHDDVVDESDERRGQPSLNVAYNNKVAVLVGDFLLASSLRQVSQTDNRAIVDIVSRLGQELADGELLQLSNICNPNFSEEVYFDVIRKKTAALFAACMNSGGLSVGISDEKAENMRLFGEYLGLCFQIKDDIFDYYDKAEIGKPTGNDMLEGKLTLPALYALNATDDSDAHALARKVKDGTASSDEIARLIEFTKKNGGIEYARRMMIAFKNKALDLLSFCTDDDTRKALTAYVEYVVDREK